MTLHVRALHPAFEARNEIAHALDLAEPRTVGNSKRRSRELEAMMSLSFSLLDTTQRILNAASHLLLADSPLPELDEEAAVRLIALYNQYQPPGHPMVQRCLTERPELTWDTVWRVMSEGHQGPRLRPEDVMPLGQWLEEARVVAGLAVGDSDPGDR